MVEIDGDRSAALRSLARAMHDQIVPLDLQLHAASLEPLGHGGETITLLDAQLTQAPHAGGALGVSGGDRQDRIFVDHRRRALGGDVHALQRTMAQHEIGHRFAGLVARIAEGEVGAHLLERLVEPGAQRIDADGGQNHLGAGHQQGGHGREGGRGRIGRHDDVLALELGLALEADGAAAIGQQLDLHTRTEAGQHALGMVPRRRLLDHGDGAGRVEAGQQDGGFDLGRGDRQLIGDRQRIAGADHGHRQTAARTAEEGSAHAGQRLSDAAHGTRPQRGVTGEGGDEGMRRHQAHHQAGSGAGIAHVEHVGRFGQTADAAAMQFPGAVLVADHLGAQASHGLGGTQHVLAFEQAGHGGFAESHRAEHQRPMRHRFITGDLGVTSQRRRAARNQRPRRGIGHVGGLFIFSGWRRSVTRRAQPRKRGSDAFDFDIGGRVWQTALST